jgi:carbon-monoxide dehydrogenase large subunit
VDSGAYSSYPFSACLEGAQVSSILPGPYKMDRYRCRTWSVATNKAPILPYRGVARTGVCFALELMMDAAARELKMEPHELRLANLVQPGEMPYTNITKKYFDSGDYPEAVRRAARMIDVAGIREFQKEFDSRKEKSPKRVGVGFSIYCEQAAHGTSVYYGWGIPMVPGHEQCAARLSPDGVLELRIGAHSHGQGMETTMAQVANSVLGIDPQNVRLVHGDTGLTPYSTGTWGSRSMVMSGGAVAKACRLLRTKMAAIAAHQMKCQPDQVSFEGGQVRGPGGASIDCEEIGRIAHLRQEMLPPGLDPLLEVTVTYEPAVDTGLFTYATQAAVVAVDPDTGHVEILDYAVVEDCGTVVNPLVVDGQIAGGIAQGIGTALYEEMPFDDQGQPLAGTLADYLLPSATEVPDIRIDHMETPSPWTRFGQKGIGESGAIGPPAAILNAINDALAPLGAEVMDLPATPARVLTAIARARR